MGWETAVKRMPPPGDIEHASTDVISGDIVTHDTEVVSRDKTNAVSRDRTDRKPQLAGARSNAEGVAEIDRVVVEDGPTNVIPRDEHSWPTNLARALEDGPTNLDPRHVEVDGPTELARAFDVEGPTNRLTSAEVARLLPPRPAPARKVAVKPPPPPILPASSTGASRRTSKRRLAAGTNGPGTSSPEGPRLLGGYTITSVLASGGMGVVYRGEHEALRRVVAIKAMHEPLQRNPAVVARFFAESVALARVSHRNVVRFFDFGYDARGAAYLVMELLEGETLSSRLARDRRLDISVALDIAIQIGQGLEAAHEQGVIHRDVKPDNIFLSNKAGVLTVKLLDFGVAKVEGQGALRTWQGDLLGTPAYMAPEQGLSASESDARSDLYSVGCILFEMICGVAPFGGNLVETLVAHQASERPPARGLNPEIPADLDALIGRLIAREPADRPQSVTEMVRAMTAIRFDVGAPSQPSLVRSDTDRVFRAYSRRDRPSWALLIAVSVVIGIMAGALIAVSRPSPYASSSVGATRRQPHLPALERR